MTNSAQQEAMFDLALRRSLVAMTLGEQEETLRIGVAQIISNSGDPEWNLRRHFEMIDRARRAKVDLVVFPELSLSGYKVADPAKWLEDHGDGVLKLSAACGSLTVVVGQPWPSESGVRNTSIVINKTGVVFRQDKRYLLNYGVYTEGTRFVRGDEGGTFELKGFTISIHICEDAWHTSIARESRLAGADVFLQPSASAVGAIGSSISSSATWPTVNRAQAMLHGSYVAFANYCGADGDQYFWGGSSIVSPFGVEIAAAGGSDDLRIADVTRADLVRARAVFQMMDDEIARLGARNKNIQAVGK